jgi:limonene-1,2-epoxide hydrolase
MTPTTTVPRPYLEAMQRRDLDAVIAACAPDATLRSPISQHASFQGREELRELFATVLDAVEEFRYHEEIAAGDTVVYRLEGRVDGHLFEEALFVRYGEDGLAREFRVFMRPLPGLTAFLAGLAPRLGRRRSRLRGLLLALAVRPLAWITRVTDGVGARLALGR